MNPMLKLTGLNPVSLSRRQIIVITVAVVLIIYQLTRIVAFINVYGGVEHDGGWMLSVSRSLAEQGTYTTMVSTIVDPDVPGAAGVDGKFDIQAPDGRIWFFTGNGNGPATIIPDAVILKIFGTDFWALRAGPLVFYTLFLLLATYILYQLAGLGAVVLFHAYLFFYPHISIFLSYEAMGEVPSMFYTLWTFLAFAVAPRIMTVDRRPPNAGTAMGSGTGREDVASVIQRRPRRWLRFFVAGLVAGLTLNAKLITLWSLSGIFVWAVVLWLVGYFQGRHGGALQGVRASGEGIRRSGKLRFSEILMLGSGMVLLVVLWELVHLVILTRLASFELYLRHAQQRLKFILDDGSGVGLRIHTGSEFFWDKFFLLEEVAHPQRWVTAIIFTAILLGGLALLWQWRNQLLKQNLLAPIWLGWLANTAWFVILAKTGWPRHFWFGLVLAMMLLCVVTVALVRQAMEQRSKGGKENFALSPYHRAKLLPLAVGVLLLVLIGWGYVSQPHVWGFFLPDEIVPYWQEKQINNKYDASLPWIIIPRVDQAEVVNYIKQMSPEANVYYPGAHKSAEIPPQTGRIHYPLNRRNYATPHPADIALISPSIVSPWKDPVQRQDLLNLVEQECPHPAVKNDFYMICPIEDNLSPQ